MSIGDPKGKNQRRQFLKYSVALSSMGVVACGGSESSDALAAEQDAGRRKRRRLAPEPAPSTAPAPAPAAPAPAPAPSSGSRLVQFTLTGSGPFCIGHAFRQGDFPADVVASNGAQVTIKNRWPDGSAKFGIVAGNGSGTVSLSKGAAAASAPLTTAALDMVASVGCGSFGTATWADWSTPFQTWLSGPEMSSWIYRKQVGNDAHLVAWLEVRLFKDGSVEVLPWVESGYLMVAGPTNKSATFTFTLGGKERFSQSFVLPHHCRAPLVSGSAVSHWLGTDPNVIPKHDTAYLQATDLVPAYSATVSPDAAVVKTLPTTFNPLQQGNFDLAMGAGGYHAGIGLLPQWDVLYLTTTAAAAYKGMVFNGYSFGRYPIHYRDEATNKPAVVCDASRPHLCISQTNSGIHDVGASMTETYTPTPATAPPYEWVFTHHPSPAFLAYLVTGRYYFMEQVQFGASANYWSAASTANARDGAKGVVKSTVEQVRAVAWKWRTAVQAWCATPDDDTAWHNALTTWLQENINYLHGRYVAQPNNPFGFIEGYGDLSGAGDRIYWAQTWMDDFVTAAVGYTKAMRPTLDATSQMKLDAFYAWKAQAIVGRFGGDGPAEYLYRNAAPYEIAMAPSDTPDFATGKGPWYANWGAIYGATFSGSNSSVSNRTPYAPDCPRVVGGDLVGGAIGDASTSGGYWGNLQPALAYAVKHGIAGAATAYSRMTSASNWQSQLNAYNISPVWSVIPAVTNDSYSVPSGTATDAAPTTLPAWRVGQAVNEWREIANSAMSLTPPTINPGPNPAARMNTWNGLAIDTRTNTIWSLGNGGHTDYSGNEVLRFDLKADKPRWVEVLASSPASAVTARSPRYTDGRPAAVHSYYCSQFIERHGRAMRIGTTAVAQSGAAFWDVDGWDINTAAGVNGWDPQYTYDPIYPGTMNSTGWTVCKDPGTENIYVFAESARPCRRMAPSSSGIGGTWSDLGGYPPPGFTAYIAATAFDTLRGRIFIAKGGVGYPSVGNTRYFTFDAATGAYAEQTLSGGDAFSKLNAAAACVGMVYVPALDAYIVRLGKAGIAAYVIDAGTFEVTVLATSGAAIPATADVNAAGVRQYENVFSRWLFVPSLSGIVYFPHYAANAWFLRLY